MEFTTGGEVMAIAYYGALLFPDQIGRRGLPDLRPRAHCAHGAAGALCPRVRPGRRPARRAGIW